MNSKELKGKYSKDYQDFFTKNNLVISLPLLLNWSGDIFNNYKGIRIKQKIPLRIYLGINKISQKSIVFNTIKYLDLNEDRFIESDLKEYAPFFTNFSDYFNKSFSTKTKKHGGAEISILSEVSRGVGLGFISIVGLLIQIGLEKVFNNIEYINSDEIKINDFLNINTSLDNLFRSSLDLSKSLGNMLSIENQISSFFDSYYPIVSFIEDTGASFKNIDISSIKIYAYRLNNLENNLSSVPFIPIDYGLIYSGSPVLIEHIANTNDNSLKWTVDIKRKLKGYFGDSLDNTLPIRKPKFYKTFVSEDGNIFKEMYGKLMGAISLEILNMMIKLYSTGYTESNMRNFIDAVNKIRHGNYITRKSSKTFTRFINLLFDNFNPGARFFGLAPSDTTIMGGTVIFTLPLEGFRKDLFTSIEKTKQKKPGVRLLYSNWLDGIENRGFIVEQDLKNSVYSSFISKHSIILYNIDGTSKIINNDFITKNDVYGLVLDLINKKIYLDNKKLTSKDIHSQSTTIEILEILIDNFGEDVSNKELPRSSYSSNKNEMLGKIVLPLLKFIESKKNIKFPLICKGSLNDFYLKIKSSDLEISIIKKLS